MTRVNWQGFNGWKLENDTVSVVIVPSLGAKIASLVDKSAQYEWLAPPTRPIRNRAYGDTFTDHDLSGWDEMFPTINACPSPYDVTLQLPDHGEVWALPWDVMRQDAHGMTLQVKGRRLEYVLARTATLQPNGLRLDYTLENLSDKALPFLWAAHPLFNADSQTRIGLPKHITSVVNVSDHPEMGKPEIVLNWQQATLADGRQKALNTIGEATLKDYRKFYAPPAEPLASAYLQQGSVQRELHLSWDSAVAPYLGIWVDEGTFTRTSTVALEPATGYYDDLSRAVANQRVATVMGGSQMRWWLEVHMSHMSRIEG